jgi:energy-coupling factor transporter ATP-binding protein EcfA2
MRTPPIVDVTAPTDAVSTQLATLGDTNTDSNAEAANLAYDQGLLDNPPRNNDASQPLADQNSELSHVIAGESVVDESVVDESASASRRRLDILYRLVCFGQTTNGTPLRITQYLDEPFSGVDPDEDRQRLSIMDVLDNKTGMWPDLLKNQSRPLNQVRQFVGTAQSQSPSKPFELHKDFIVTSGSLRTIRIMSTSVINFIKEQLPYWPPDWFAEEELYIPAPFQPLAFTYEAFRVATMSDSTHAPGLEATDGKAESPEVSTHDLEVVFKWYQPTYQKDIEPELEVRSRGMATYAKLWLLFKPGTTVSVKREDYVDFYKVRTIFHPADADDRYWMVSLWQLDFEGTTMNRRAKSSDIKIQKYPGEKEIIKLPVAPIEWTYPEKESRKRFVDRGKRFHRFHCQDFLFQSYHGALSGNKTLQYSGRVIIDPSVYGQRLSNAEGLGTIAQPVGDTTDVSTFKEPNDNGGGSLFSALNNVPSGEQRPFPDEEMFLLFPRQISGFALGKRQWAQFDIEGFTIDDANQTSANAFADLVMDPHNLECLKALTSRTQGSHLEKTDFIEGKGQGKTILLYGPPGVGKSFTVECLAKAMHRPLLSLTVADIRTEQSTVERNLSGWLDLAQRWDAIILLDEADTYLEKRKEGDLSRNTLVAAFLRVLEYYPGLLFLTTNKPGWMDDAFQSRLYYTISYPNLTDGQRKQVWQKFLHKSWRVSEHESFEVQNLTEVLSFVTKDPDVTALNLNGRDIRNAFQAAAKLALYKNQAVHSTGDPSQPSVRTVAITIDEFKTVTRNKQEFQLYLDRVNDGQDAARRAFEEKSREPEDKPPDPEEKH